MADATGGRVVWITGASTGIGRALAQRLARQGWRVAASARTARDLDSLAAEVEGRITAFQLDVTDEAASAATAARIETALGPIELAILNAGASFPVTADDFSVANFRRTVDVNLMGEVNGVAAVLPAMRVRRGGHIILMGSLGAFVGVPTAAAYGASKAALNSLAQSLRPELARFGIMLTIVNPGFVKTPLTDKNQFPMPFLMDLEPAIDHIMRGIAQQRFEIAFPWQMSLGARVFQALPNWAKYRIARRTMRRGDSS